MNQNAGKLSNLTQFQIFHFSQTKVGPVGGDKTTSYPNADSSADEDSDDEEEQKETHHEVRLRLKIISSLPPFHFSRNNFQFLIWFFSYSVLFSLNSRYFMAMPTKIDSK